MGAGGDPGREFARGGEFLGAENVAAAPEHDEFANAEGFRGMEEGAHVNAAAPGEDEIGRGKFGDEAGELGSGVDGAIADIPLVVADEGRKFSAEVAQAVENDAIGLA